MKTKDTKERTVVFIDGPNLYSTIKLLNFDLDYISLKEFFDTEYNLLRANYYTTIVDSTDFSPIRPLVDFLDYNGYSVIKKQAKEIIDQTTGAKRIKGSIDVDIAVDMIKAAMTGRIDHIVLMSGNGDFKSAVKAVQDLGVKVTVISTIKADGFILSDDLRRQVDDMVDLSTIQKKVSRAFAREE